MAPKKSFLAMKQIICFQILILTFTETRTSKSDCTVMTFLGNGSNILSDSKEMVGCILGKSENKTELTQRYIKCVENCFLTKCYTSRPYCKLILSIVKTINNATKKNKKGFANPTSRDKCCLKDLHNIEAEDLLSSVPVSSPFPVSCSKGFFEITPEVTCEYTANRSSPVWSTKHPCVEIPNVWVKFNEISSENVSLTWNYTQIPSKVYYVNITVSCQLERLFGRTCSRHESATVHPEGPGEITCAALRPFSHYFLNFTVKVFNTRLKNKTQRLEFEGPLQNEVIFFNTSQTVPDKPEFHNSSFFSSGWIQWRPLSDCTGTIIAYELNYTGKRDYNDSFIETYSVLVNSSVTSYNLPNLKSATNYSLGIRGFTEAGAGEVSLGNFQTELKEPVIPETENLTAFNISSGTAVIPLHPVLDTNGPISSYQVIVLELESVSGRNRSLANICVRMDLAGFNSSSAGSIIYIAGEIPAENLSSLPEFTVGDGKLYGQYYNAQLQPEKNYSIIFRVISKWKQEVRFSCSEYEPFYVPAEVQHDASHQLLKICLYVFLPVTCTLLLVFLIFIWRCTPHHGKYIDNNALALSVTIQSDTMPVEQLIQHVIHMKQDCNREAESEEEGGLTKEFKSLPKSCFGTCEAAKNQSNKGKNRYKNSVPCKWIFNK
uniref:Uncharacterized LOC107079250 n=1 Tax=Lepisosteus oculatus TaxID=7918 RepID=W5MB51_LEPOC|nr:PREDICTED: uncharacterized protein LOC107079250 [Lepisosteus oculatus]